MRYDLVVKWIDKISSCFFDLIYPPCCFVCQRRIPLADKIPLCLECRSTVEQYSTALCLKCGSVLRQDGEKNKPCDFCRNRILYFDQAFSVCEYSGIIKDAVHLFKYQRRLKFSKFFVELMHQFIRVHLNKNEIELVMAVPLHITKLRQRGFNQSEIIARILSEQLNLKYSGHNLCRKKRTKSQVDLARAERLKNVSGAFTLRDPDQTRQKSVLLIDDIFTTGATLNECAYVLKRDGLASKVTVLTIAR